MVADKSNIMKRYTRAAIAIQTIAAVLWSGLVISGCGAPIKKAATPVEAESTATGTALVNSLTDTQWHLVEFQSMDDSIGTQRPANPSLYTMRLNSDGTVVFRLNCNSAHGSWSAQASQEPTSGKFVFGPLLSTKTLCPPPSLDEQITEQTQHIRSYLLKDGRLYLSLMADGGIYAWEPHNDHAYQTKPDPILEEAILQAFPDYTQTVVNQEGGTGKSRYIYGRVDLNGDGRDEVFVYLLGSIFCGTGGCNLLLFTYGPNGYLLLNDFPISRLPVIVSSTKTAGWSDLWQLQSGGGASPSYVRHSFDGKQYVERERVSADKIPDGKSYLTGELTFDKGIPLKIRN